jgi:hypothetical protein
MLNACLIKTTSEFDIFKKYKKYASLIITRDTTFIDHTGLRIWKFMNSILHRKWVV